MKNTNTFYSDCNTYSLENLLLNYIQNPKSVDILTELLKIIESAMAFQKGKYLENNYITPSAAYNVILQSINATDNTWSFEDVLGIMKSGTSNDENKKFVKNFLEVLSSQLCLTDNKPSQLVIWR